MIRHKKILLPIVIAALILASCASKPQPKPTPPTQPIEQPAPTPAPPPEPTPPKPEVNQAELDALLSQVQAAKKRAFDLKLFEILPDDYKSADAAYAESKASYDAKEGFPTKDKLGKALALYNDLNSRGIVELTSIRRKEALDLKAPALKAEADKVAAERFAAAEKAFATASAAADSKDFEAAIASFDRAKILYELAYKKSLATGLKNRIEGSGFSTWDSGNYQLASTKYLDEDKSFASFGGVEAAASPSNDSKPLISGLDNLDEAILRFNLVVLKGRQGAVIVSKDKTDDSRQKSEDIKANVAAKEEYGVAPGGLSSRGRGRRRGGV